MQASFTGGNCMQATARATIFFLGLRQVLSDMVRRNRTQSDAGQARQIWLDPGPMKSRGGTWSDATLRQSPAKRLMVRCMKCALSKFVRLFFCILIILGKSPSISAKQIHPLLPDLHNEQLMDRLQASPYHPLKSNWPCDTSMNDAH